MTSMSVRFSVAAGLCLMLMPGLAQAESYANLVKQGYKTGKLSQSKSGSRGWVLTKEGKLPFFCRLDAGVVYDGKDKMAAFTSSGRIIPMDKKTFENYIGGHDPSIPNLVDLRAGRPRPQDVSGCSPHRM